MFDFLKGGKATIEMTVDHPSQVYKPGETIHATVTIKGEKDVKIHAGWIGLFYMEDYQYKETSDVYDSESGSTGSETNTAWAHDEHEVSRQLIIAEGSIPSNYKQTFNFTAAIPPDAPPTCGGGKIMKTGWYVKTVLERKMAKDFEDRVDLQVLSQAPGTVTGAAQYGHSNEPDDAGMFLTLPGKEFKMGDIIQGKLTVMPKKNFTASAIRLDLVRKEMVSRADGNEYTAEIKTQVSGKKELKAGEDFQLPFSLAIPDPSPVTYQSPKVTVTYTLRGVLARTLRKDTAVEEEISIYHQRG